MPWCDTYAMTQHLAEIARHVDADAHAILIMDQAGWHMSNNLVVPENITILPLPPKSPELNPVENLWHFMRDNWLSNRVFKCERDEHPTFPFAIAAARTAPSPIGAERDGRRSR